MIYNLAKLNSKDFYHMQLRLKYDKRTCRGYLLHVITIIIIISSIYYYYCDYYYFYHKCHFREKRKNNGVGEWFY